MSRNQNKELPLMNETENFVDADGFDLFENDKVNLYQWGKGTKADKLLAENLTVTLNVDADIVDGRWEDCSCVSLVVDDGTPYQYLTFDPRTGGTEADKYYILKVRKV
jgi:hypothetical protein